jgi:cell division protein FtsQ
VGSALLVLGTVGWLWQIGWPQKQGEHVEQLALRMTQKMGFTLRNVIVEGRNQTSRDDLSKAVELKQGSPLFALNLNDAHEQIGKLPWIDHVVIERRLPDTIHIHLEERQPLARWQIQGKVLLIDKKGVPLPDTDLSQFENLPLVVGKGAPSKVSGFLKQIQKFPNIPPHTKAMARIGERRWDLYLQPNVIAKLPEGDVTEALKQLSDLIEQKKILEREAAVIDLRLPDRLVIEPLSAPLSRTREQPL